jgi:hypothetical protein
VHSKSFLLPGRRIPFLALIGDDHLFLSADKCTVYVAQISSRTVVARTELTYAVHCAAALPDGRLAVCGDDGKAIVIDAPAAAADIFKAHGAATPHSVEPRRQLPCSPTLSRCLYYRLPSRVSLLAS